MDTQRKMLAYAVTAAVVIVIASALVIAGLRGHWIAAAIAGYVLLVLGLVAAFAGFGPTRFLRPKVVVSTRAQRLDRAAMRRLGYDKTIRMPTLRDRPDVNHVRFIRRGD